MLLPLLQRRLLELLLLLIFKICIGSFGSGFLLIKIGLWFGTGGFGILLLQPLGLSVGPLEELVDVLLCGDGSQLLDLVPLHILLISLLPGRLGLGVELAIIMVFKFTLGILLFLGFDGNRLGTVCLI